MSAPRKLIYLLGFVGVLLNWGSRTTSAAVFTPASASPVVLPAPLYFIDGATRQLMRLERDGVTLLTITHETAPITDFDVSPSDGSLVYVSGYSLVQTDSRGEHRIVKVTDTPLKPDSDEATIFHQVRAPRFSPDGKQIAFGLGGINFLDSATQSYHLDLFNDPFHGFPSAGRHFWPDSWSPDGKRLLLNFSNYGAGGGQVIYELATGRLIEITAPHFDTAVGEATWSQDSQAYLLSPGLALVDSATGVAMPIVPPMKTTANKGGALYPWGTKPYLDKAGHLLSFIGWVNTANQNLRTPSQVTLDTGSLTPLSDQSYEIDDALWAPDGSGALLLNILNSEPTAPIPYAVNQLRWWVRADGSVHDLPHRAILPRWGEVVEQSVQKPKAGIEQPAFKSSVPINVAPSGFEELAVQFLQDMGLTRGFEVDHTAVLPLLPHQVAGIEQPLWLIYTTGVLAGLSNRNALAIYTHTTTGWHQLTQFRFYAPNIDSADHLVLDEHSVQEVFIEVSHLWLQITGIGGVRSTYHLLSFTGKALKLEVAHSSLAIEAGRLVDLNNDGAPEVLLNVTKNDSYLPECNLFDRSYLVMHWDGRQISPILPTKLPSTAPQSIQALNNQAVALAQAGLWSDATTLITQAALQDSQNITVTWNKVILQLNTELRRNTLTQAGYPLLGELESGDFDAALKRMSDVPVDQIFNWRSAFHKTVWPPTCSNVSAYSLKTQLETGQAMLGDRASVYFLYAWAAYLNDGDDPSLAADVKWAFTLAPDNQLIADSYAYLSHDLTIPVKPQLTARTTLNVRVQPGTNFPIIGQLITEQSTLVVGKLSSNPHIGLWWQIIYPPQSGGRGWVSGDENLVWTRRVETVSEAEEQPVTIPLAVERHPEVRTLLVARGAPGRLYALLTDEPVPSEPATHAQLLISDDFGQTWTPFVGGLPVGDKCLFNLNLAETSLDALYASTCQGLYRWAKPKWQRISTVVTGMVAFVPGKPNELWATTPQGWLDGPFLHSTNGGQSWLESKAITHFNGVANLVLDPRTGKVGYAVIWPKYGGSYLRQATLITDTAQIQWQVMATPGANQPINTGLAIDPNTGDLYVVAGPTYNQIWRGSYPNVHNLQAIHWELWYDFGEKVWVNLLASGWSPQGLALYANVGLRGGSKLYRSLNAGKIWEPLLIETR